MSIELSPNEKLEMAKKICDECPEDFDQSNAECETCKVGLFRSIFDDEIKRNIQY